MRRNVAIRRQDSGSEAAPTGAPAGASGLGARGAARAPRGAASDLARWQRQQALDERQELLGRLLLAAAAVHDRQVWLLRRHPAALVAVGEEPDRRHPERGGEMEQVGVAGQEEIALRQEADGVLDVVERQLDALAARLLLERRRHQVLVRR